MQAAQQTVFANVLTPEIEHRKPGRKTHTAWVVFAFFGCLAVGWLPAPASPSALLGLGLTRKAVDLGVGSGSPGEGWRLLGGWGSKLLREPHCEGRSWLSPLYPCPEVSGRHRCYV